MADGHLDVVRHVDSRVQDDAAAEVNKLKHDTWERAGVWIEGCSAHRVVEWGTGVLQDVDGHVVTDHCRESRWRRVLVQE